MIEIRVAGAESPRQPVPAALGDRLAVHDHLELALRPGKRHDVDTETLSDEGHETRDLGFVVLSRRAGTYLNFHFQDSKGEKAKLLQLLKDSKESETRPVVEDIYWANLSSREFLFNH